MFGPLLRRSMAKARSLPPNKYLVLLIFTDGDLSDFLETCDILIDCSRLPLSLIIVGLGSGDFTFMQKLDDNDMQMTNAQGQKTERDLVRFVQFATAKQNPKILKEEVIKELPRQIVEYCRFVGSGQST